MMARHGWQQGCLCRRSASSAWCAPHGAGGDDSAARDGPPEAARQLLRTLFEFVRDSTPERRRQRYGDAEYDWEYRVNTTSAGVGWRDRLLGFFHSPYQPTESVLFHEMIGAVSARAGFDFREFIFLDLGSGKGRTLLMASDYPFRRIVGVELLPALNRCRSEQSLQVPECGAEMLRAGIDLRGCG